MGLLTPLKHNSGSTLEVLLRGSNRGKELLVGAVDVRVGDQVVVESPVNDRLCSMFSSQRKGREGRGHAEWRQQDVARWAGTGSQAVQIVAEVGDSCCQLVHRDLEEGVLLLHGLARAVRDWGALG